MTAIAFLVAAAIGAPARYLLDRRLPWGTFVVNVSGSLLLGFLAGLGLYHGLSRSAATVLGTGFCGAYTTFSTASARTVALAEGGETTAALVYAGGSLLAATLAGAVGLVAAAAI